MPVIALHYMKYIERLNIVIEAHGVQNEVLLG